MHAQEKRILMALIENLGAAGFKPAAVWTDECYLLAAHDEGTGMCEVEKRDEPELVERPLTLTEVIQAFEQYDMYAPTVHFTDQYKLTWGPGVMVVPGNLCDFISDWHCDNAAFNAIVEQVADAAGNGVYE